MLVPQAPSTCASPALYPRPTVGEGAGPAGSVFMLTRDELPTAAPVANHLRFAELVRGFHEIGIAVTVASGPPGSARTTGGTVYGASHSRFPGLPGSWPGRTPLSYAVCALPWLDRRLREVRPSWIFTNSPIFAPVLGRVKRALGDSVVIHADFMGLESLLTARVATAPLRPAEAAAWTALERVLCATADVITTVNEAHATLLRDRYDPPAAITVLRDAADPAIRPRRANLSDLGVPFARHRMVFVGSLFHHRLDDLFAALPVLAARPDFQLIILGDGPDRSRYEQLARRAGFLGSRVIFLGYQPHAASQAIVAACDIGYSDCWSDTGFAYKLFEYMALRRAIVTERKPQISEVLTDGRDALFYSNAAELALRVREILDDPRGAADLGRQAGETLARHHTWAHRRAELARLVHRAFERQAR